MNDRWLEGDIVKGNDWMVSDKLKEIAKRAVRVITLQELGIVLDPMATEQLLNLKDEDFILEVERLKDNV